jgi:hypothetical protein
MGDVVIDQPAPVDYLEMPTALTAGHLAAVGFTSRRNDHG